MSTKTLISANDVTLFHIAAKQLGDATQWWRIAQLNGLSDPDLSGFMTPVPIQIPAVDPTQTSGVPGVAS